MAYDLLMSPEVGMRFLVWSYYYHGIIPDRTRSYKSYNLFRSADIAKLDQYCQALFTCYEQASVLNACQQFRMAKELNEPCPFTQEELDNMFAREITHDGK